MPLWLDLCLLNFKCTIKPTFAKSLNSYMVYTNFRHHLICLCRLDLAAAQSSTVKVSANSSGQPTGYLMVPGCRCIAGDLLERLLDLAMSGY